MLSAVIEYLDAVLFASIFVKGDFLPVAPKAVNLPDNNRLKLVLRRILQHLLELLPVVIPACLCPVNALMDNRVAVFPSVFVCGGQLSFNRLFPLLMTGVSGVDNGVHVAPPPVLGGRAKAIRTIAFSFWPALS